MVNHALAASAVMRLAVSSPLVDWLDLRVMADPKKGSREANIFRTCPECGESMVFSVDTDGTQTDLTRPAPLPPPTTWECRQCGSQDDFGADVEAKLEGRPRLL